MMVSQDSDVINEVVRRVKDFNRRIRDLEEKVRNLNARTNTIEDTMLEKTKKLNKDISELNNEVSELGDQIQNNAAELKNVQRRARKLVTRRELKEIEDYMDIMTPVESAFMTKQEVETLIEKKLQQQGGSR